VICAYCQAVIEGPPYRPCRSCASPHHIDCWGEYRGCSIPGCAEAPRDDNERLRVPVAAPAPAPAPAPVLRPPTPSRLPARPAPPPPAPAPPAAPPTVSPSAVSSGPAVPQAPDQERARAPAPPSQPARDGPWRWRRPALAATVAVLLVGTGLVVRPLIDRTTQGPGSAAPATTVPVATPSTAVPSSDDPDDTGGGPSSGAVARAIATIAEKGYSADPDDGRIGVTLSVFIGIASDSATAYNQKAFFFVGPELRYIGTDTTNPSRGIRVSWSTDATVALEYQLYRTDDANCCPSGGTAEVRYQWDGIQLTPLDEIPAEYGEDALSR
jgi:LppP/LprE lipoprotein